MSTTADVIEPISTLCGEDTRPTTALAAQINTEHAAAHADARSALERARKCGDLLLQAKAQTEHGAWLPWIDANLSFGARQAQKYIRLADSWDRLPNANSDSLLPSIDAALATVGESRPAVPSSLEACERRIFDALLGFLKGCAALREIRDLLRRSPHPEIASFEQYAMKIHGLGRLDIKARMTAAAIFDAMGAPHSVEAFQLAFDALAPTTREVICDALAPSTVKFISGVSDE